MTTEAKNIITEKRGLQNEQRCERCGHILTAHDYDRQNREFTCPACTAAEIANARGAKRVGRKPLMETTFADGTAYVPLRDQACCSRCSDPFSVFQFWYYPAEIEAPVCASCLEEMQQWTERWFEQMAEYAELMEQGMLDRDMREPQAPLYEMPF